MRPDRPSRSAPSPWDELAPEIDTDHLRHALQRGLPHCARGAHQLDSVRVLKAERGSARRRDPHPVALWLEVQLRDHEQRRHGTQRLYGKAFRDGASAAALEQARRHALARPEFGEPVSHLPELDMLVWAWPNDPVLTQLPRLIDPGALATSLPLPGAEVVAHEVLRYEPEHQAMLRVGLRQRGRAGLRVVYGKTFADGARAVQLHERFMHFWQRAAVDAEAPRVAEPLGVDDETRTLWQGAAQGVPLLELVHGDSAPALFAAVGRALARLHATALRASAERSASHWVRELERGQRRLARLAPALTDRAAVLVQTIRDAALSLPAVAPTLIHGDFHAEQVWIDGGRAVFFDFDAFRIGHPMEDLARFGVRLQQSPLPRGRSDALVRALEWAYRDASRRTWCPQGLAWHRAVQSLLQAGRAFTLPLPGWQRELEWRLARAELLVREIDR